MSKKPKKTKEEKLYIYLSPARLPKKWCIKHQTRLGPLVLIGVYNSVSVGFKPIKRKIKQNEIMIEIPTNR